LFEAYFWICIFIRGNIQFSIGNFACLN
jgi:hypothetical protein